MSLSLNRKLVKLEFGWFGAVSDPPVGPVMLGWPFVPIDPCEYAAAVGLTPAQYCAPLARLAVIDAEPPTWIWVDVPGGCSPPAHTAQGGARKATVSDVIKHMMISVSGSAMPSSDPRRRTSELFIESSGERGSRRPPVGSPAFRCPGSRPAPALKARATPKLFTPSKCVKIHANRALAGPATGWNLASFRSGRRAQPG